MSDTYTRQVPLVRSLWVNQHGATVIEFALVTPLLLVLGLGGIELANLAITQMRLGQAAGALADNASRVGDSDLLESSTVYEKDINDLFIGLDVQSGGSLDIFEDGRVILSSLERNSSGGQWIHWQRCMGKRQAIGAYGSEGTGATGTGFKGMGPPGSEVKAPNGSAVMFVEITYEYQPLIGGSFVDWLEAPRVMHTQSAFLVRGMRDLNGPSQHSPPTSVAKCNKYDSL